MKRVAALFAALLFLLSGITSLADEFEEFEEFDDFETGESDGSGDEEEFEDIGEATEEDINNAKSSLSALSGYHDQEVPEEGDFKYEPLSDGASCQILRYTGFDEDVFVPEKVKDLSVTGLYQTFSDCSLLETVVLPESLVLIDNMAFWKCINLKHIEIQEGLTRIGRCSFGGCAALESIEFPESLETVDDMVFISCVNLKELSFGKNLKSIGSQAFTGCINLKKISVPRGTVIAEDAFEQCPQLDEINYYDVDG